MLNLNRHFTRDYYVNLVLPLVLLFSAVMFAYYTVVDYFIRDLQMRGVLDFLAFLFVIGLYTYHHKTKKSQVVVTIMTLLLIGSSNTTLYLIGLKDLEFVWLIAVPIIVFLLTDIKRSILLISLHVSIFTLVYFTNSSEWKVTELSANAWINMMALLIMVSIFLYVYASIRDKMMQIIQNLYTREAAHKVELASKNDELSKVNAQLHEYKNSLEVRIEEGIKKQQRTQVLLAQQSKMAAMGEMLALVGHQWKQPLSVISANTANLEFASFSTTLSNKEIKEHTSVVGEQVDFMTQTLQEFSNFFRPDKQKEKFSLENAIEDIFQLFSKHYSVKNIDINIELVNSVDILNYKNEFRQVILNILNNAKDVIVDINPTNRNIDIKIFKKEDFICCEIQDHAGGIAMELLPTIFDSFVTSKSEDKGSGIGLYMSKMIIESSMQGKLEAQNRDNGACFIISLPL